MPARRTHLRRPGRRYRDHLYARSSGLVFDKLPQLVEGPGIVQPTLRCAQALIHALANTGQVLQHNGFSFLFSLFYDVLADAMVHPLLVAALFTTKPFEDAPRIFARRGRARVCLRLKRSAGSVPLQSVGIQRGSSMRNAIGERSDFAKAQVYAQRAGGHIGHRQRLFDLDVEVVAFAFLAQRRRGGRLPGQGVTLKVAHLEHQALAAAHQGQADLPVGLEEAKDPRVVVHTGGLEATVARLGLGEPSSDAGKGAYRQVGRQAKALAHSGVAPFMQGILPMGLVGATPLSDKVTGLGKGPKGRFELRGLGVGDLQLTGDGTDTMHVHRSTGSLQPSQADSHLGATFVSSHPFKDGFPRKILDEWKDWNLMEIRRIL